MHAYKLQVPINKFIRNYSVYPFKRSHHTCTYTHTSSSTGKYLIYVLQLLLFSYSVMSDSLRPHGLQHTRLPCSSPSPGACSKSCPLSSDAIRPSCPLSFSSPPALKFSQPQGSFPMNWLFATGGQVVELQLQHKFFSSEQLGLISFRIDWFDLHVVQGTLKRLLQHHILQMHQFFGAQPSLCSDSHIHNDYWKNPIALTRRAFVSRVMSQFFNMFSRFVIAFLPRCKCL